MSMSTRNKLKIKVKPTSEFYKPPPPSNGPKLKISLKQMVPKSKTRIQKKQHEQPESPQQTLSNKTHVQLHKLSDFELPPFNMTANARLQLLQSHFLSVSRLTKQSLVYCQENNIMLPFKLTQQNTFELYDPKENTYSPVASNDIILDDITIKAWKFVVNIYDRLKQKNLLEDFLERLGNYTTFRIHEFIEEYTEFMTHGPNITWKDFKDQVFETIKQHFYPLSLQPVSTEAQL